MEMSDDRVTAVGSGCHVTCDVPLLRKADTVTRRDMGSVTRHAGCHAQRHAPASSLPARVKLAVRGQTCSRGNRGRESRGARAMADRSDAQHRRQKTAVPGLKPNRERQRALSEWRYGVIYADPPWRFEPYSVKAN
jgi:hypothetical protein